MKTKIYNYDRLAQEEINEQIIRVKALIINSHNEILLGTSFGTPQFPGGHKKDNETLEKALKREIKEETGITLRGKYEPYYSIKYFLKDYPDKKKNTSIEIYYYIIHTDTKYDLSKISLDPEEKKGNFTLMYLPLNYLPKYLKQNIKNNPINKIINREMLLALKNMR